MFGCRGGGGDGIMTEKRFGMEEMGCWKKVHVYVRVRVRVVVGDWGRS